MIYKQLFHGLDFTFYLPSQPLSHFLHCFIEISGKPVVRTVRNFPVLKSEITFNLSGAPIKGESGKTGKTLLCNYAILRGTMSVWQDIYLPNYIHLIGISFKPEVLYSLFNIPPYELNDQFIESNLVNKEFDDIWHQLIEAENERKRFEILERWLMKKILRCKNYEHRLLQWIREQCIKTNITVLELEKQSGFSRKHLFTEFKKHTGVSIKHYQELLRFQRIISDLKKRQFDNLTSLANKHRFFDQSHFINTFKHFTGMTPGQITELFLPLQTLEQKGYNLSYSGTN